MSRYLPDEAADRDAGEVLRFWFGEPPEYGRRLKRWFEKDPAFDRAVQARFLGLHEEIARGARTSWLARPAECLARILVLDQFPRNMFRGSPRAFATDAPALEAARHAIAQGYDRSLLPVERLFVYLPFEHAESLEEQQRACALFAPLAHYPETDDALRYAIAHRDIVRRFGRFPHRNAVLGRPGTAEEIEFLKGPGSSF
jgi:uncharacterized protein (DUF924 family)